MLKTRVTELLGIRYPIISAPMVRMSGGRLACAVSSAGGLGTFGCVNAAKTTEPAYVREQINYIRSQTDKPFGVGFITQHIPAAPQNFETVLEEEVPVTAVCLETGEVEVMQLDGNSNAETSTASIPVSISRSPPPRQAETPAFS